MPSVVQTQTISSIGFMLKEKAGEPLISGFTAVNGRASPPSPPRVHGMTSDTVHVRSLPPHPPDPIQDQKAAYPGREGWSKAPESGALNGHQSSSVSPTLDGRDRSPLSPGKRKRSSSADDHSSYPSPPEGTLGPPGRRLDPYMSGTRDDSPHPHVMDPSQPRTLPPLDRADHDRPWPHREVREPSHNSYPESQYRDPRAMDAAQDSSASQHNGMADSQSANERSSTTEITRAGVQVDPKKRKRQFANRTKTGCGTCRRRKKKCDEGKPECNNCIRGGFICEGYANKVPWPKNGIQKPHPPLQAKDQYRVDPAQLYHNHGTGSRESYSEPTSTDGARSRPIVVEEHDRRNGWGSQWDNPPRASYPPEHAPPAEYGPPPPAATHGRPPSNDHHVPHPSQGPPRQHNPRIYHHTPQTMSQTINSSPAVTAEAALHHPSQPPHHPSSSTALPGPPVPPPTHYSGPPPPRPRSEKEKMLSGEPFQPYHPQLLSDREKCRAALYRLNNLSNPQVDITPEERERHVQAVVLARWTQHYRGSDPPVGGHLGTEVFVDTPFHCDYGYNLVIQDRVTIGPQCKFLDSNRITIGRNTTIQANVTIDTQRVPDNHKSMKGSHGQAVAAEVHIGENVYIGANCTITAGVKIGTGAIIYPGTVVIRDVPRDVVVRGNPGEVRAVGWD